MAKMLKLSFNDIVSVPVLDVLYTNFSRILMNINVFETSAQFSVYWANNVNNKDSKYNASFQIYIDASILPRFPLC